MYKNTLTTSLQIMKRLVVLRHGKSSWGNSLLDDFDRPLNERGKENSSDMGFFLFEKLGIPDIILSSSAKRAFDTAKNVAEAMEYPAKDVISDSTLYLASVITILDCIGKMPDTATSCILVGHNPGLTDLVNYLGVRLDNLPTASAICFTFETDNWNEISSSNSNFEWIKLARDF